MKYSDSGSKGDVEIGESMVKSIGEIVNNVCFGLTAKLGKKIFRVEWKWNCVFHLAWNETICSLQEK